MVESDEPSTANTERRFVGETNGENTSGCGCGREGLVQTMEEDAHCFNTFFAFLLSRLKYHDAFGVLICCPMCYKFVDRGRGEKWQGNRVQLSVGGSVMGPV